MVTVKIFQNSPEEARKWDDFVLAHPQGTSDHLWCWRRILEKAFGFRDVYYLGAFEGDKLQGILPLFLIPRGLQGKALTSIPFGNYGGICATTAEAEAALFQKAASLLNEKTGLYLELRHRNPIENPKLKVPSHSHSRYFVPTSNPETHWKEIGQNNRSKIQRARKWGLKITESRDADAMYPIYTHTAHRQGVPCFPKSYFQEILREFGENSKILLVQHEGQFIAYYLNLYFKNVVVAQFAGSFSDHYSYYPNELLFWTAIEEACALKFREFDFCRSREGSGTANFKKKLRFHSEPLPYQYYLPEGTDLPSHSPTNSKFQLAIKVWRKLPLGVTLWTGPKLVRYFA